MWRPYNKDYSMLGCSWGLFWKVSDEVSKNREPFRYLRMHRNCERSGDMGHKGSRRFYDCVIAVSGPNK